MKAKELKQDKKNYRKHSAENKRKIKKSIDEAGFGRSVVIDADGVLVCGNGVQSVIDGDTPVRVVETDGTELVVVKRTDLHEGDDKRKLLALADNATADGVEWDADKLVEDWGADAMADWDVKFDWGGDISDKLNKIGDGHEEGNDEYNDFVDKFKDKHTTDDCYTPKPIYNEVVKYVGEIADIKGRKVVRPFYVGGDYEHEEYPKNCVVIDNPPFSIYSKIVRFYLEKGIDFFLFGPSLTIGVLGADVCYVMANAHIVYENGARINTSFVTNLVKDYRVIIDDLLQDRLENLNVNNSKELKGKNYNEHIYTFAVMGKIASHHTGLKIRKDECFYIESGDTEGGEIFGSALLLSDRAAAERAAAERAAAERVDLSEKGKARLAILNSVPSAEVPQSQ